MLSVTERANSANTRYASHRSASPRQAHAGVAGRYGACRRVARHRKAEDELRALAVAAADGDPAAEKLDELLRDAEPEACPAVSRGCLLVDLLEVGSERRHVP